MTKLAQGFALVFIAVCLGSCSVSFDMGNKQKSCGKFELPKRDATPKLPSIAGMSPEQINDVLINTIKEHREYINKEHKTIDALYANYSAGCN